MLALASPFSGQLAMIIGAMSARWMSLVIWATVAAAAVFWGLRLWVRPQAVPSQAVVANLGAPAGGDLSRLLGAPPVQPVVAAAELPADSRFRLLGVVAPRAGQPGGQSGGLALVSVDGKPARAVAVGRDLEPGLRLLTVSQRQADFGASAGAATLKLSLPPLLEATRGRPGDAAGVPQPGLPAFVVGNGQRPPGMGQNGAVGMPGMAVGGGQIPGVQRVQRVPGAGVGGGPVMVAPQMAEPPQQEQADGAAVPTR